MVNTLDRLKRGFPKFGVFALSSTVMTCTVPAL